MTFQSTASYVATADLSLAVNAAITLQRPLLIKGEPGTGKTLLAEELARSLQTRLITWHIINQSSKYILIRSLGHDPKKHAPYPRRGPR